MAFTTSAPTCTYLSQLQSSSAFKLHPLFLNSKWLRSHRPRVRAASANVNANAAHNSGNGAILAEKPDHATPSYGRRYFPLAAVVGQVKLLSLSLETGVVVC